MTEAPKIAEIADYWVSRALPGSERRPVHDAYELTCFACGWWDARGDGVNGERGARGLERAHAVPESCNGSSDPGNFALLCKRCHLRAPNTTDEAWFWRWIDQHPADGDAVTLARDRMREALAMLPPAQRDAAFVILHRNDVAATMFSAAQAVRAVVHWGETGHNAATLARVLLEAVTPGS